MRDADATAAQQVGHGGERFALAVAGGGDGEDEIAEGEGRAGLGGLEMFVHGSRRTLRRAMRGLLCAVPAGCSAGVSIRDAVVRKRDTAG